MARPGPQRTLTPEQLLDAAQELLAERGAAAVSIRGIAGRVGVAPNAVYTYFPDKAAVLGALVDRVLGRLSGDRFGDPTAPWQDRIRSLALALRSELLADPGVVQLMGGVPLNGPNALEVGESLLEVLAAAGLDDVAAARASYLLTVYVLGAVALEVAELEQPGPPPPEDERVAVRAVGFAEVPAEHYPRSAAVADTMASYITTEQFRWGLDRILDGLVQAPATDGRSGRTARTAG